MSGPPTPLAAVRELGAATRALGEIGSSRAGAGRTESTSERVGAQSRPRPSRRLDEAQVDPPCMAEEVEGPLRTELLPAWMRQPEPGQRQPVAELGGQQDVSGAEVRDAPAPDQAGEVDPRALPSWMVAIACALPMPPAKVLAQVEGEHVDGLPRDWEDPPSWGEQIGRAHV